MTKNTYLTALYELGQSIWYDNLSIDVLNSGELANLVAQGVTGLTSNPTIFKNSIADTNHYDHKIKALLPKGLNAEQVTEELMIEDVGTAADLLRDTYDRTRGVDGYASIEVSPELADDTEATFNAAKRLWLRLDRPNIMIKIPATKAGIMAIEQTLSVGINVNVTLIFSVDVYKQVVGAYLAALKSLKDSSAISNLSSVASFFVSRVDSLLEKKLSEIPGLSTEERLRFLGGPSGGSLTAGIANSKMAYQYFEQVFGSDDFKALKALGAHVQRPLWASTGVKNPAFPELLYVESLIGSHTVNTLPPKTLKTLLNDCTVLPTLAAGQDEAEQLIRDMVNLGVNFDAALLELQNAGVKAFKESYTDLLKAVEEKQQKLAV
jgi:transaldolase